jgi:EAL domain-containing protein (putative c-di-GMP-specific phosphodiesterase class I)/GGDEF domain-containing protein
MTGVASRLLVAHRQAAAAPDLRAVADLLAAAVHEGLGASAVLLVVWEPLSRDVRCAVAAGAAAAGDRALLRAAAQLADSATRGWAVRATGSAPAADEVLASTGGSHLLVAPLQDARGDDLGVLLAALPAPPADVDAEQVVASVGSELLRALRDEQLQRRALYDLATGLPGGVLFEAAVADALGSEPEVAVLLVSVDQLVAVARSFGRVVADELARKVAARLLVSAGPARTVARLPQGFGLLVRGARGSAAAAADAVTAALQEPWVVGPRSVRSTCRGGLAVAGQGATPAGLLEQAETALAEAGRRPRGGWVRYGSGLTASAHQELELETLLQAAVAAGDLHVRYQPQVEVSGGRVTGAEALVRWHRPEGVVTPDQFIPAAEASGVIVDIDRWVMREALMQARAWSDAGMAPLRMAVNVSSRTLSAPGFTGWVIDAVEEAGLPPDRVEVEITESLELLEAEDAVAKLTDLRERGLHIALDDFGTGYSNVGRLRSLPVDRVKIDQSFVRGIAAGGDGEALCTAVIGLARTLDLDVIAEGVETVEQLAVLEARGCAEFQGYLKSPPVPPEAFVELVG